MAESIVSAPGWVKLYRKTVDSEIWGTSYLARCVFFWLLMTASYNTGKTKPGELITSYKKIAAAVAPESGPIPTTKQMRVAVGVLERAGVVSKVGQTSGQRYLHLKLLHWDTYQATNGDGGAGPTDEAGQTLVRERAAIKEVRSKKKERTSKETSKNISSIDDEDFNAFWKLYPRKDAKPSAFKKWVAALKITDAQTIITGLERQLPSLLRRERNYRPMPATWLYNERWADEVESAAHDNDAVLDTLCSQT